jgi:PAS domain S-box-containing protein
MTERERFLQIFRSSAEGIVLLDAAGVVQAWNPAMERMTGLGGAEIVGSVWSDRISLVGESGYLRGADLGRVLPDETLELIPERGRSRWVSVFPAAVALGDGSGLVVLVKDATAEYELERSKTDFLATISHELRTPLTGIKGSLEMLREQGPMLEPQRLAKLIEVTSWGARRLERLVMNLLLVSDISAGDMPVRREPVELGALARQRMDEVLARHDLTNLVGPDHDVIVMADPHWLAQALDHVLDNARKFGGSEGRITVAIDARDGEGLIAVSDEGRGVPEADRDRVFERFTRLGDVMTRKSQEGAGVGLYIVRRSMEAMGGRIFYDDSHGDSTFVLSLALDDPTREWAEQQSRRDASAERRSVG